MIELEEIVKIITLSLGSLVEGVAAIIIAIAILRALVFYTRRSFSKSVIDKMEIRLSLGKSLALALEFLLELFATLKQERGIPTLITALKKGSLEGRLMDFFPMNKRTEENLKNTFSERGLDDIVKLHKNQAS